MCGLTMDTQLTIGRILERAATLFPDKAGRLPHGDRPLPLHVRRRRAARARGSRRLPTLGVKPGDRLATFAWNTYRHLEPYFAIPGAGYVLHTLNLRLFPEQVSSSRTMPRTR